MELLAPLIRTTQMKRKFGKNEVVNPTCRLVAAFVFEHSDPTYGSVNHDWKFCQIPAFSTALLSANSDSFVLIIMENGDDSIENDLVTSTPTYRLTSSTFSAPSPRPETTNNSFVGPKNGSGSLRSGPFGTNGVSPGCEDESKMCLTSVMRVIFKSILQPLIVVPATAMESRTKQMQKTRVIQAMKMMRIRFDFAPFSF